MVPIDLKNILDLKTPALVGLRYVGLSTSVKPTALPDGSTLPPGATFQELDTRVGRANPLAFLWNGTAWNEMPAAADPNAALSYWLQAILEEIKAGRIEIAALRAGMIDAGQCNEVDLDGLF